MKRTAMMTKSKSRSIPKLPSDQAAAKLILMGCHNSSAFNRLSAGRGEFEGKQRPADVPSQPLVYYTDVKNWMDFFQRGRDYLSEHHTFDSIPTFDELKRICKSKQIDTKTKYKDAVRAGLLGINVPKNPEYYYGSQFRGWDELLADRSERWWSYDEARSFMLQYKLENINDWRDFCRKGLRPKGIPSIPARHYAEFISWAHFLGVNEDGSSDLGQ